MGIEEFDEDAFFAKDKPNAVIEDFSALDPAENEMIFAELTNGKGDDEE